MGLLDKLKRNRAGNIKEEYMAPRGYEAKAIELKAQQRKEKLQRMGALIIRIIKKCHKKLQEHAEKRKAQGESSRGIENIFGAPGSGGPSKKTENKRGPLIPF